MSRPHIASMAVAALLAASPALARSSDPLPPFSGTIDLDGRAPLQSPRAHAHAGHRHVRRYVLDEWSARHRYDYRIASNRHHRGWMGLGQQAGGETFWNRRVEFYGEGNNTLALTVNGWGTADSATTAGAYPPPSPYHVASAMPGRSESVVTWSGLGRRSTAAPSGGLGYYSSGSSAGPYGSTGGLAIYSSGSYGPGPKIIRLGQGNSSVLRTGPHIIHVDQDAN